MELNRLHVVGIFFFRLRKCLQRVCQLAGSIVGDTQFMGCTFHWRICIGKRLQQRDRSGRLSVLQLLLRFGQLVLRAFGRSGRLPQNK